MDPYETDPAKIPPTDLYSDVPHFGRYLPKAGDFTPNLQHVNSVSPDSIAYWAAVLARCTPKERIYPNDTGGRDVFALGSVIIKSAHLKEDKGRDYALADANEAAAMEIARPVLEEMRVRVPRIYFAGKIDGRSVLFQERIPGVALNVAWAYLSPTQKATFKDQARTILQKLHMIKPQPGQTRSYVVPDCDPVSNRGLQELEKDIIFSQHADDPDLGFVHNDLSKSNIIVRDDRIVAVIDWEMAGYFGWKTAADVHAQIRSPKREGYAALNLPDDFMNSLLYWNDLFEVSI